MSNTGSITVWSSLVLGCLSVTVYGGVIPFRDGYGSKTLVGHLRHRRQAGPMSFPPGMSPNMPGPFPHPMSRMGPGGMFGPFSNPFNRRQRNNQFQRRNSQGHMSRTRQTGSNRHQGGRISPVRQTASTNRMHLLPRKYAVQNRRVQGSGRWSKQNGNIAARNRKEQERKEQKRLMNNLFRMNLQSMQQNKIQTSTKMRKAQPLKGLSDIKLISDAVGSRSNLQQKVGRQNVLSETKGSQSNGQVVSQNQIQGYSNSLDGNTPSNQPKDIHVSEVTQQQGEVNSLGAGLKNIVDTAALSTNTDQTGIVSNLQNENIPVNSDPGYVMPVDRPAADGNGLNDMNTVSTSMDMGTMLAESEMNGPYDSVADVASSLNADAFLPIWSEQNMYQEMPLTGPSPLDVDGNGINGISSGSTVATGSQDLGVSSQINPGQTQGNTNDIAGMSDLNGAMMNTVGPNGVSSFVSNANGMSSQISPGQPDLNGGVDPMNPDGYSSFVTDTNGLSGQASPGQSDLNGLMDPIAANGFSSFGVGANGDLFINSDPGYLPVDGTSAAGNGFNDLNTASSLMDMGPMTGEPQINGPYDPAVGNQGPNMQDFNTLYPAMDTSNQGLSVDQGSQVLQGSSMTAESQMNRPYDSAIVDVGNQGLNIQDFNNIYPAMDTNNLGLAADQSSQVLQGSSQPVDSSLQSAAQANINSLSAGNQDVLFQDPQVFDVAGQMSTQTDPSGMVQYEIYSTRNSPFLDIGGGPQGGVVDPLSSNGQFDGLGLVEPAFNAGIQGDTLTPGTGNNRYVDNSASGSPEANVNFM